MIGCPLYHRRVPLFNIFLLFFPSEIIIITWPHISDSHLHDCIRSSWISFAMYVTNARSCLDPWKADTILSAHFFNRFTIHKLLCCYMIRGTSLTHIRLAASKRLQNHTSLTHAPLSTESSNLNVWTWETDNPKMKKKKIARMPPHSIKW